MINHKYRLMMSFAKISLILPSTKTLPYTYTDVRIAYSLRNLSRPCQPIIALFEFAEACNAQLLNLWKICRKHSVSPRERH